jgi:hypothetical protein
LVDVVVEVARGGEVDHQEPAAGRERGRDRAQNLRRPGLVVDRVERGDQLEAAAFLERGNVAGLKARSRC